MRSPRTGQSNGDRARAGGGGWLRPDRPAPYRPGRARGAELIIASDRSAARRAAAERAGADVSVDRETTDPERVVER